MNPKWCPQYDCDSLCSMETLGGGKCIGKLETPLDHVTEKTNTMGLCWYDRITQAVQSSAVNQYDFIVDIYLRGIALNKQGLGIPIAIIENLPGE